MREGRIPKPPDGEYDVDAVRAAFAESTDGQPSKILGSQEPQTEGNETGYYAVKTQRETVKLKLDRLALEAKEKRSIDIEDARRAWSNQIEAAKMRLLLIPAELGDLFGVEAQVVADRLIRAALREAANYQPKAA